MGNASSLIQVMALCDKEYENGRQSKEEGYKIAIQIGAKPDSGFDDPIGMLQDCSWAAGNCAGGSRPAGYGVGESRCLRTQESLAGKGQGVGSQHIHPDGERCGRRLGGDAERSGIEAKAGGIERQVSGAVGEAAGGGGDGRGDGGGAALILPLQVDRARNARAALLVGYTESMVFRAIGADR